MKKKIGWPEALKDIVEALVIGWIIFSIASCTAKCIKANADAHAKIMSSPGVHIE
jgi:hypothetical protein